MGNAALFVVVAAFAALAAVIVVIGWSARRRVVARLAAVTSRLGGADVGDARPSLEQSLRALEQAASAGALRVSDAALTSERLVEALALLDQGLVVLRNSRARELLDSRARELLDEGAGAPIASETVGRLTGIAMQGVHSEEFVELLGPPRRSLRVSAAPLVDGRKLLGAAVVIEDVSERRRLEAIRRDFVANISHELKTPIGAVGLLAETLADEDDPVVTRRLAERMHDEAMRVARIIDDLLDLSRIESEETPRREPVPVHLVLSEAVDRLRPAADHAGVDVVVTEPPKRLTVVGDRRQLVSALHSLVENAISYSEAGASVHVAARLVGAIVEITVSDTGIGIPARDLDRIFERFYRVDRARARATGGTGLGLAIVRHVMQNHGGDVQVHSQEGRGSTFTLTLPAGPGHVALPSVEAS